MLAYLNSTGKAWTSTFNQKIKLERNSPCWKVKVGTTNIWIWKISYSLAQNHSQIFDLPTFSVKIPTLTNMRAIEDLWLLYKYLHGFTNTKLKQISSIHRPSSKIQKQINSSICCPQMPFLSRIINNSSNHIQVNFPFILYHTHDALSI